MKTERVSHIGILVHDVDAAVKKWTDNFGFKKFDDMRIEVEGIRSVFISPNGTWNEMTIELMEPLDKLDQNNALARRLASVGEGFYHICLDVEDVEESGRELQDAGYKVFLRDPIDENHSNRWLVHPKDSNGVMVEGKLTNQRLAR